MSPTYNFRPVVKKRSFLKSAWDHDAVRVAETTITIGSPAARRIGGNKIAVEYSPEHNAIRLTQSDNGWTFKTLGNGPMGRLYRWKSTSALNDIPLGDYSFVGDNVYVAR